jgi:hypothetical protein
MIPATIDPQPQVVAAFERLDLRGIGVGRRVLLNFALGDAVSGVSRT